MLNKIEKIEEKLNVLIIRALNLFKAFFVKLIGEKRLLAIREKLRELVQSILSKIKNACVKGFKRALEIATALKNTPKDLLKKSKSLLGPIKQKFRSYLSVKEIRTALPQVISKTSHHLRKLLIRLKRPETSLGLLTLFMLGLGSWSIYISGKKIYTQEFASRSPASVSGFEYLHRPEYRLFQARSVKIFNVKIPIYKDSRGSIRSVTADFSVRTDTRFAKQFLEEYEYKVKDHFFTSTEPMQADFSVQEEGKAILKEKIKDELNRFLKLENVEGRVIEVDVTFIIAS